MADTHLWSAGRRERISALDASNLRIERHGYPMTVSALAVLEPTSTLARGSQVDLDALSRSLAARVSSVPRLRQVLVQARSWGGGLAWADDPDFDLRSRLRSCRLPSPGDEAALLDACCEINRTGLDPTRSPWELWLLTGRDDGTVALLLRLHHVVADGIAALTLLGALFDPLSDAGQARGRRSSRPGPVLRAAAVLDLVRLLREHGPAPALSFNQPVTGERQVTLVRADLGQLKAAAHARDGTVNDVLLAAVGEGVRALCQWRDEPASGQLLRVSVPATLRTPGEASAGGNRVAVRLMPVRLDEPDPGRLLTEVVRTTRAVKRRPPLQPSGRLLQRWMVRGMARQRLVNVLLSNLPGPEHFLRFQGSRVRELLQLGPLQGNVPLNFSVLSYDGKVTIAITSDRVLVPDVARVAEGMTTAMARLGALQLEGAT